MRPQVAPLKSKIERAKTFAARDAAQPLRSFAKGFAPQSATGEFVRDTSQSDQLHP